MMDKAVVKAFRLLELLAQSEQPIGVTALARAADLGKSNVHRLLQTMQELGYVRSTPDGTYETTLRLWEMGSYALLQLNLRDVARPFMQDLSEVTKETVHLSELDGFEVLYIDKIESREPVRAYTQLGGRAPAYCTATGKAMMAYLTHEQIATCYDKVQQYTPKTIVNLERFLDETEQIRKRRYAINRGEWRADIMGLAAAVAGSAGEVVGAIGISGPASRLHYDEFDAIATRLVKYAEEISLALGCSGQAWATLGADSLPPPPVNVAGEPAAAIPK